MIVNQNFVPVVLGLTLVVYLLFGGLGLIVLAVGAYIWHLAPYRRGIHSEMSETHHTVFLLQQDALEVAKSLPHRPSGAEEPVDGLVRPGHRLGVKGHAPRGVVPPAAGRRGAGEWAGP